jgi:hypothetical protein
MRYTGAMLPFITTFLAWVSRVCGFDTVDSFPPGHAYARTRWDPAYFDIASDLKPEAIERAICEAITNTPTIFGYIVHPTPRMQRALLAVVDTRLRRSCGNPTELVAMLITAYRSPYTQEAMPGLRAAIAASADEAMSERARGLLAFLGAMPSAFDVIDA